MRRIQTYRLLILLTTFVVVGFVAQAQRVAFKTWAASGITIQPVSVNTLSFGNLIKGAQNPNTVTISGATAFEITAPEGYDLTITIDQTTPGKLMGPDAVSFVPFSLKYAYSNQGYTESQARLNATEVTTGFSSVTFPVKRNAMGLPAPPPTPLDGETSTRITAKAYLFIYGSAGPAGTDAAVAGSYNGTITINVEYTQ